MKIVLVNHSDSRGGASVVSVRLLEALRALGVDARMLVTHKSTDNPWIETLRPAWRSKACFLAEHADIYLHNGLSRKDLFKASIAICGMPLHKHPWVREADAVILNWVNQGMLSLDEIARIQAPVIWTMHDMWCLTGVCHHAGECIAYKRECGNCRLMHGGTAANDLSRRTLLRKRALYAAKPIHFVAVSRWLAEKARGSSLLRDADLSVIPNAFPVDSYRDTPAHPRSHYGLPEGRPLIVMGAARLDDPIKGLPTAIEALNKAVGTGAAAVFFGALRDSHALDGLRMPHVHLGPVASPEAVNDLYAHADVVLSTSHYETLPGTLVEGMAAGCMPVTFGRGGQADIVAHLRTGYIATYPDADNIAEGIRYCLSGRLKADRAEIRRSVAERFSAPEIARRYIELINNLTKQ